MTCIVIQGAASVEEIPGLAAIAHEAELRFTKTADGLRDALAGADVLLGWDFAAGGLEDAWDQAGNLRWIHWCGAGVDAALFPGLTQSEVILTNARGVFDRAMAEYALGQIIAFAKRFPVSAAQQARGQWLHHVGAGVEGARVLVVGVGSIGREIARLVRAVGMVVEGVGRRARDGDGDFDKIHGPNDLTVCLAEADYVVLITPLTAETTGMFGPAQFAAMKPSACFINLGRGLLVDEAALIAALDDGAPGGAVLDVFVVEPLPSDSPLWAHPGVVITPHNAGDFTGYEDALAEVFLENFRRYTAGEPLYNLVDKTLGFVAR